MKSNVVVGPWRPLIVTGLEGLLGSDDEIREIVELFRKELGKDRRAFCGEVVDLCVEAVRGKPLEVAMREIERLFTEYELGPYDCLTPREWGERPEQLGLRR